MHNADSKGQYSKATVMCTSLRMYGSVVLLLSSWCVLLVFPACAISEGETRVWKLVEYASVLLIRINAVAASSAHTVFASSCCSAPCTLAVCCSDKCDVCIWHADVLSDSLHTKPAVTPVSSSPAGLERMGRSLRAAAGPLMTAAAKGGAHVQWSFLLIDIRIGAPQ